MTTRWLFVLVLALATGVRLFRLTDRVVWFDEAVSLLVARAGITDIVAVAVDDTHPLLHQLALHFLPPGELPARLFSVVCGVLTVALVYLIGQRLCSHAAQPACGERGDRAPRLQPGLISAAVLALCPLHVWYSQEVRMYALQTLLVTASWWLLLAQRWPSYVVVTALSLFTQYTSAFAIVAQGLYVVWCRRDVLRSWLWSVAAAAVLFAPGVPLLARQYGGGTFGYWMKDFSWADPVRFFALLSGAIPKNPGPYWPWGLLSLFVVWQGRKSVPLMLWLLVPVGLLAALSVRANVFLPRSLVMVAPAFALLLGVAATNPKHRRWVPLTPIMATLVVAGNLRALSRYYFAENAWIRSDLRVTAARVAAEYRPGDLVVHTSRFSYRPFQFYLDSAIPQVVEQETENMPALFKAIGTQGLPAAVTGRVWLVVFPDFQRRDAGAVTAAWLQKQKRKVIRLDCGRNAP